MFIQFQDFLYSLCYSYKCDVPCKTSFSPTFSQLFLFFSYVPPTIIPFISLILMTHFQGTIFKIIYLIKPGIQTCLSVNHCQHCTSQMDEIYLLSLDEGRITNVPLFLTRYGFFSGILFYLTLSQYISIDSSTLPLHKGPPFPLCGREGVALIDFSKIKII